jgi:hypothetical protein
MKKLVEDLNQANALEECSCSTNLDQSEVESFKVTENISNSTKFNLVHSSRIDHIYEPNVEELAKTPAHLLRYQIFLRD